LRCSTRDAAAAPADYWPACVTICALVLALAAARTAALGRHARELLRACWSRARQRPLVLAYLTLH
jgi:hypothetical protein